jgi:alpha-ketoglutarate-dependent taurine dioxygenase
MPDIIVRDLHPSFGAEIVGFDRHTPLDPETNEILLQAFDRHGLLIFRDIDIAHADQVRLCEMLIRKDRSQEIDLTKEIAPQDNFYVSNKRPNSAVPFGGLRFHSDMMWSDTPFHILSLYAVNVEQPSVPTIFVSATDAWANLPEDLRKRIAGLNALHTAGEIDRGMDKGNVLVTHVECPPTSTQPMAYPHPRTGEFILYACEMNTDRIVGMEANDSEHLLKELFSQMYAPARQLEHRWRNRDLVIWDNLSVQHARPEVRSDGFTRTLRKVASPIPKLRQDQLPTYPVQR